MNRDVGGSEYAYRKYAYRAPAFILTSDFGLLTSKENLWLLKTYSSRNAGV